MGATLTPLSLVPPAPVDTPPGAVDPQEHLPGPVVQADIRTDLERRARDHARAAITLDSQSPALAELLQDVERIGERAVKQTADATRALTWGSGASMKDEWGPDTPLGEALARLERLAADLDPRKATEARGLSALLSLRRRLASYFRRYESSQSEIDGILEVLQDSRSELRKGSMAIRAAQMTLWERMFELNQAIILIDALDSAVTEGVEDLAQRDPSAAHTFETGLLYAIRARHETLRKHSLVCANASLTMPLVLGNNTLVERGIKEASTSLVAALRTAMAVARSAQDTELQLQHVRALNKTTAKVARGAGKVAQGDERALEPLITAFSGLRAVLDKIETDRSSQGGALRQSLDDLQRQSLLFEESSSE